MSPEKKQTEKPTTAEVISILATLHNLIDSVGKGDFVVPLPASLIRDAARIIEIYLNSLKVG